ncbi:hypothetical protein IAT38_003443 [Cryptococcus sp. DSM 104549]
MENYSGASTQQPAAICALKSPADAIHILEAVRLGIIPRVTRRLTGHERAMIRPGTVWVWEEEETNMRRWTDGRRWGASRVGGGGFLVYTESSESLSPPPPPADSTFHARNFYDAGVTPSGHRESLIKQTYSTPMTHPVTGKVKKFHVVAYSSKHNPQGDSRNPLPLPHQLPSLRHVRVPTGIWPEWEHRREPEYGTHGRRSTSSTQPLYSNTQSVPATAISSPTAQHYPTVPPTAQPGQYPPSPRQDGMYGRPMPSTLPPAPYPPPPAGYMSPGPPATMQNGMRPPIGRYTQPYQSPARESFEVPPMGYPPARPMPHSAPGPGPQYASSSNERYHPYAAPQRSNGRASSSYPVPPTPLQQGPPTEAPREMDAHAQQAWAEGHRISPTYGYAYPRQSPVDSKPRQFQDYSAPPAGYGDRASPETKARVDLYADPRRFPMESAPQNPYAVPSYKGVVPPSGDTQAPLSHASGRSPKMSIPSSLLYHEGGEGGNAGGVGVTLPPLRATFGDGSRHEGAGGAAPTGKVSPSSRNTLAEGPAGQSPSEEGANKGQKSWGEDARQLGELGRRVML